MLPVYQKMSNDSADDGRLANTMKIFRGCRFFNYEFVANNALSALVDEIAHISIIPLCYDNLLQLERTSKEYKKRADQKYALPEEDRPSLWEFWTSSSIALPLWSKCADEIALITPSSCTVERVFSLLTQGFSDNQEGALEDYVFASVLVRYNQIWQNRDKAH